MSKYKDLNVLDSQLNQANNFGYRLFFIRIATFAFFASSFFVHQWFFLPKSEGSVHIDIGIFKYCDKNECSYYPKTFCKYFKYKSLKCNISCNYFMANNLCLLFNLFDKLFHSLSGKKINIIF